MKCNVKGCENESDVVFISHDLDDKEICSGCSDKYFTDKEMPRKPVEKMQELEEYAAHVLTLARHERLQERLYLIKRIKTEFMEEHKETWIKRYRLYDSLWPNDSWNILDINNV